MNRRSFLQTCLRLGGAALLTGACRTAPLAGPARARARLPRGRPSYDGPIAVWSWFDLPNDPRSRELSGIAWDDAAGVLWAVQDATPSVVSLRPDPTLKTWAFADSIPLQLEGAVDLEGLILLTDGFVVCSEIGPRIVEVDRQGRFRREHRIPARFREARPNRSLESLTLSPSGRFVFTTSEVALARDGATASTTRGTRVRIVRLPIDAASRTFALAHTEVAYETDPAPFEGGDWGVADLAALSDDELLVLERGWTNGYGNVVRIYQVRLDAHCSCEDVDELSGEMPVLDKVLRVDVGKLPASGLPPSRQAQPNPLLDNYEGLALGPRLEDGRPTLLLASDDNGHATQVARILVLACG